MSATAPVNLSVVIACYRSAAVLGECLASIVAHNDLGEGLEVIVVDSSPTDDGTAEVVRSRFPEARLLPNPANLGFGQANNVGARASRGRLLLFLNPDTVLIEPVFRYAVAAFDRDPGLGACGFTLVDRDGRLEQSFGVMPERRGLVPPTWYHPFLTMFGTVPTPVFPWGANLMVRRDDFLAAGAFDERIFLCYEEPDLVRRLPGRRVRIFPKRIVHLEGHTTVQLESRLAEMVKSEAYYFHKHGLDHRQYARTMLRGFRLKVALKRLVGRGPSASERFLTAYYRSVVASGGAS